MSKNFRVTLNEQMKNDELKKEWDHLEVEFQIIKAIVESRNEKSITQKQLSSITGISQGDISKIENKNANPSLRTLKRIANALGKEIKITFEEKRWT